MLPPDGISTISPCPHFKDQHTEVWRESMMSLGTPTSPRARLGFTPRRGNTSEVSHSVVALLRMVHYNPCPDVHVAHYIRMLKCLISPWTAFVQYHATACHFMCHSRKELFPSALDCHQPLGLVLCSPTAQNTESRGQFFFF